MSAKLERKMNSIKRMQKREKRHADKHKKKRNIESDDEDDCDDVEMPVPSQMLDKGSKNVILKDIKRKKKTKDVDSNSRQPSFPIKNFANFPDFKKIFWTGAQGEDPPGDELKLLRKSLGVLAKGQLRFCPPPVISISNIGLPETFGKAFLSLNYSKPSPVQMQCWPAILMGQNLLCVAPTGSGKTLAYGLPMMPHICQQRAAEDRKLKRSLPSPYGVVLVPTRELCIQVVSALTCVRRVASVRSVGIYGGQDKEGQLEGLRSGNPVDVIVATPGRLVDLITSSQISLDKVTYLVIDEADRMLLLGFEAQLDAISAHIRPDRQTLLFSATFPGRLRAAAIKWLGEEENTVTIRVNTIEVAHIPSPHESKTNSASTTVDANNYVSNGPVEEAGAVKGHDADTNERAEEDAEADGPATSRADIEAPAAGQQQPDFSSLTLSPTIVQHVHVCAAHKKPRLLMRFISTVKDNEKLTKIRNPGAMIIFCTKIKTVKYVVEFLRKQSLVVEELHGQLQQSIREKRLSDFRAGKFHILCATDVAARGLHIKRLQYVVNYDFPSSLEQYCHRVGRTGRQGATGESYSLLTRNMAPLAESLIALLRSCNQVLEPNLQRLYEDFKLGVFHGGDEEEDGDVDDGGVDDNDETE